MNKLRNVIIYQGIPFFAAFGLYYFEAPWYVAAFVLVSSVYWYGPVLVYLRQRMPAVPSLRPLDFGETLPTEHSRYFDKTVPLLQGIGFVELGRFVSVDKKQSISGTATLLQNQESSDLAHLLIATKKGRAAAAETLVFSRARSNGSKIVTTRRTIQSPFPPNPLDSVLSLDGGIDAFDLWRVHRARVAADAGAMRNVTVKDAFGFQTALEKEGIRKNIASGLWRQDERTKFLRPTPKGALVMCLRMLAPWKQVARLRARLQMRRHLRESDRFVG